MVQNNFAKTVAVVLSVFASMPMVAAETTATTAQRNKQIVVAAFDRWAAGGAGFFNEMLSPDVVWTIEGSGPSAGIYRGREDFTERALRPFASRMRVPVRPVSR